jgi:hypothetical protein
MNSAGWVSFTSAKWVKIQSALTPGLAAVRGIARSPGFYPVVT